LSSVHLRASPRLLRRRSKAPTDLTEYRRRDQFKTSSVANPLTCTGARSSAVPQQRFDRFTATAAGTLHERVMRDRLNSRVHGQGIAARRLGEASRRASRVAGGARVRFSGQRGTTVRPASLHGIARASDPSGKRHGLGASGRIDGGRALDCRPWHSARPCSKAPHHLDMHHTAPRPSGERQTGSGG
jgi:hypothetical protein